MLSAVINMKLMGGPDDGCRDCQPGRTSDKKRGKEK